MLNKGFTLVELLVGIGIFSLLITAVIGILVSEIKIQKESLNQQEALQQLSFVIEYMSRALRMAVREDGSFGCLSEGFSYENPGGNTSAIKFINHLQEDDCQEFFLEDGRIKYRQEGNIYDLTPPDLQIKTLSFFISGESIEDTFQPRVTIFIESKEPERRIQTTVSQRNLDIVESSAGDSGHIPIGMAMVDNPGVDDHYSTATECLAQDWKAIDYYDDQASCTDGDHFDPSMPDWPAGLEEDFACMLYYRPGLDKDYHFSFQISPDIGVSLPSSRNDYYLSFHIYYNSGGEQTDEEIRIITNPGMGNEQSGDIADLWNGDGSA